MKRALSSLTCVLVTSLLLFGCGDETRRPTAPPPTDEVELTASDVGNLSGAIFTTTPDGGIVNENTHYQSKLEVYLDGGPGPNAPQMAAGLPQGLYVFQVTDPSGKVLLSEDPSKCRVVRIEDDVIKGLVLPSDLDLYGYDELADTYTVGHGGNTQTFDCHVQDEPDGVAGPSGRHDTNIDVDYGNQGAKVVQLMPFLDTPNPGGVYKAWVTPLDDYLAMNGDLEAIPIEKKIRGQVVGFDNDPGFGPPRNRVKTDNFKVREQPPRLYVFKYEDVNGNGEYDAGDIEIEGWKVTVKEYLGDDTYVENDYYTPACIRLHPGVVVDVTEDLPEDWVVSFTQIDGGYVAATQTVTVSFEPGQESRDVVFGNRECIDQGGIKFHDLNANGVQDTGEPGLEGWEIVLEGVNGKGEAVYLTAYTDANGHYLFECLEPGDYTVREICPPEGWVQTYPAATAGCGSGIHDRSGLESGDAPADADFGNTQLVDLKVWKFFDRDLDKTFDPEEQLLDGFEFCLYDADWVLVSCQTTPESGWVEWTGLMPGTYTIVETDQPGWFNSTPKQVTLTVQSGDQEDVYYGNVANCVGLTPGYWKNWRNHYTAAQFEMLLVGTIASTIAEADFIFAEYDASDPGDLTILKAFVLANQLTINLTLHPELPNPSGGNLFGNCTLRDYPSAPTLGEALSRALEILDGAPASDAEILEVKTTLDRYANQRWIVYP